MTFGNRHSRLVLGKNVAGRGPHRRAGRQPVLIPVLVAVLGPLLPLGAASLAAESYTLVDRRQSGELCQVEISVSVEGELFQAPAESTPDKEQGPSEAAMRGEARLRYDEKLLSPRSSASGKGRTRRRTARYYRYAKAVIEVGKRQERPALRPECRLLVSESDSASLKLFCPGTPLTRAELDLIEVPTSSTLVYALLPNGPVKVGDSWQHDAALMERLFQLDSLTKNSVKSTLARVQRDTARIAWSGELRGRGLGQESELDVSGEYRFDLRQQRISWMRAKVRERRSPGQAMPGFRILAEYRMRISPRDDSPALVDAKLHSALRKLNAQDELVHFISNDGRYDLLHDRRWHVMVDRRDGAILRMVDHGDVLAQCNISKLPKLPAGKQIGLEEFQDDIERALGKQLEQFESASQKTDENGRRTLRVVALGNVEEVPLRWIYYHLSGPDGARAAYLFTLENELAARFGQADRPLVSSLRFSEPASPPSEKADSTAKRPARWQ